MPRRFFAVVAALVLVAPLYRVLPLEQDDPLRATLALLPAIVAAFLAIGTWARRHGGRRMPAGVARAESVCLALLVLAAIGRSSLGLRYPSALTAGLIAAGFALLLAFHAAYLVTALRPPLGRRQVASPGAPFFFLPLVVYLAILPWVTAHRAPDGDEPYNLLVAHSLAFDFDTDLTNNYAAGDSLAFMPRRLEPQVGDPVGPNGQLYSRHNSTLPLVLAPVYRVGGKLGALSMMAVIAALAAFMVLRLATRYFPQYPGGALLAWAVFAFSPPLLLYSYQVWTEVPALLLTLVALDRVHAFRAQDSSSRRNWLVFAAALALLPLLKLRFVVLSLGLLLVGLVSLPRSRRTLVIAAFSLAFLAIAVLLFNALLFDNPLKHRSWRTLSLPFASVADHASGANGILYDCAFGLFAVSPIWLLLWPAAVEVVRRHRRLAFHVLLLYGPYLPFVTANSSWYGGWSPPMRYALVVLPLASIALVPLFEKRHTAGARFLLATLGCLTLLLAIVWTIVPGWTYNMADGRSLLIDHLSMLFDADAARFFPSSIRPRLASWLWAPVTALAVITLWHWPRRPRRAAVLTGIAVALLALPALSFAARHVPSSTIEFEDPWVEHEGGTVHPPRWTVSRHSYRGSWQLLPGNQMSVPLVAGGEILDLEIDVRVPRVRGDGVVLTIGNGDAVLGRWHARAPGQWRRLQFDSLPWSPGDSLVVALERASPAANGTVVLDRARLRWRPE